MLENPTFLFGQASPVQVLAFIIYAGCTVGFAIWVAYLVRE